MFSVEAPFNHVRPAHDDSFLAQHPGLPNRPELAETLSGKARAIMEQPSGVSNQRQHKGFRHIPEPAIHVTRS